jgi:hypothetical protein
MPIHQPPQSILLGAGGPFSHTGNTDETALVTISLGAGTMGINGVLRLNTLWEYTNSANTKTVRARLGGLAGSAFMQIGMTTSATANYTHTCRNYGAANAQRFYTIASTAGFGNTSTALGTASVDTSLAQDVVISAQLANAGETITLIGYDLTLLRP